MAQGSPGHRSELLLQSCATVLEWNVWWRFGNGWQARQPLIVDVIKRVAPDIIALQEVWGDERTNQAAEIARLIGFSCAYAPASHIDGLGFGNAILSRWPIEDSQSVDLPSMPSEDGSRNCNAIYARIAGPRGAINVCSTHLSYKAEESGIRQQQVTALCGFVRSLRPSRIPPLICGDFNAVPVSDEIRMLTGKARPPVEGLVFYDAWEVAGGEGPGFTWDNRNPNAVPALEPNRRLDYVLVGKPAANGAGHVTAAKLYGREPVGGLCPSDHYALSVTFRY
ncbi:MAG TPA: endonuclease/exonuclease/phosphatase family protein [Gammaproteobacteria bacterium]|nr:endonuclease/exonuclease/phosphatase family protein [Gammaproteobacteria bacterium]